MPFKSAEIRWFSKEKEAVWNVYEQLLQQGEGNREPDRTDYYLKSGTINTGIKIREGNHELKVKCADDDKLDYGIMEHWIKWSTAEEENILNTVDDEFLDDWIAIKKKRFKKSYKIITSKKLEPIVDIFPDEGCGAEFTEIYFPSFRLTLFTFGMEAFSSTDNETENLFTSLELLKPDIQSLESLDSFGYPELIHRLG